MNLMLRLPPPRPASATPSWRDMLSTWWTTSRPEFTVATCFTQAVVAALLALRQRPLDPQFISRFIAGLGIWWLSISVGAALNCLADYETDGLDEAKKARLAGAIDVVGSRRLWRVILAEIGLLLLVMMALAHALQQPLLLGLWLTGLLLAFMYSFEPYRIKGRGLLSPVAASSCVVLPMLFMYYLLASPSSGPAPIVIGLFGLQSCGLMLVEQVSDHHEDQSSGNLTASVRYGRYRTTRLAAVLYTLATAGMVFVAWHFWPASSAGVFGVRLIALALYSWVLLDLVQVARLAHAIEPDDTTGTHTSPVSSVLKGYITVPRWAAMIGLSAWALLSVS